VATSYFQYSKRPRYDLAMQLPHNTDERVLKLEYH